MRYRLSSLFIVLCVAGVLAKWIPFIANDWSVGELKGRWVLVRFEDDGVPFDVTHVRYVAFDGRFASVFVKGEREAIPFAVTIHGLSQPGAIDIAEVDSKDKDRNRQDGVKAASVVWRGLYELQSDKLIICIGRDRPDELFERGGPGQAVLVFRRM
jgi:uncharacterized protein (TIGR03067 family)